MNKELILKHFVMSEKYWRKRLETSLSYGRDWLDDFTEEKVGPHHVAAAIERLCERIEELETEEEKERRIYYQSIVYDICNSVKKIFRKDVEFEYPVVGTKDNPSTELQDLIEKLCKEHKQ